MWYYLTFETFIYLRSAALGQYDSFLQNLEVFILKITLHTLPPPPPNHKNNNNDNSSNNNRDNTNNSMKKKKKKDEKQQ